MKSSSSSSSKKHNNDEAPPPPKEGHVFNLRKRKVPRISTPHMGESKPLEIIPEKDESSTFSDCRPTPPSQTIEGRLELYFVYFVWTVLSFVLMFWIAFILITGVGFIIGHDVMKKLLVEFLNDPMAPFRGKYEFSLGF